MSLDLYTFDSILNALCPQCSANKPLSKQVCLNGHCGPSCTGHHEDKQRNKTLAALCLTSRSLNELATRHLYHRPLCSRWPLLARTLIARPDLGHQVKHLSTREWDPDASPVPDEVKARWEELFPESGAEEWHANNILQFCVSLCPRVEEVDALLGFEEFSHIEVPPLAEVRTVALAYADTEMGLDLIPQAPLGVATPNLETLMAHQVSSCERVGGASTDTKHLRLDWSSITEESLTDLLTPCPRLLSFRYTAADATVSDEVQFSPREAQDALVRLVPGLRSLRMDLCDAIFFEGVTGDDWLMRDLTGLARLESLTLEKGCILPARNRHVGGFAEVEVGPVGDMVLVDLLPASIRELRVESVPGGADVAGLIPGLLELGDIASARFPQLSLVEVSGANVTQLEACRHVFESAGVQFRVCPQPDQE